MNRRNDFRLQVCGALLLVTLVAGCGNKGPVPIDPIKTEWLDYSDVRTGYAIKYPAAYNLVPGGNGEIAIKGPDKKVAYRVRYTDYDDAKKHGLWVLTDPVGTEYISGGFTSHRYVYDHYDGPVYSRIAAYVIEREGKMLGLEFNLDKSNKEGTLDPGQQEVLKSFTIL